MANLKKLSSYPGFSFGTDYEYPTLSMGWYVQNYDVIPSKIYLKHVDFNKLCVYLKTATLIFCNRGIVNQNTRLEVALGDTLGNIISDPSDDEYPDENNYVDFYDISSVSVSVYVRNPKKATEKTVCECYVFYNERDEKSRQFAQKLIEDVKTAEVDVEFDFRRNVHFLCYNSNFYIKQIKGRLDFKIDLADNYSSEFIPVHQKIVSFLESGRTGLVLLHSAPGHGKSFYLKHLINTVNKKIIIVPPNLIHDICSPAFLSFLLEQSNFCLVVEDAESLIEKREGSARDTGVSNLLNMTSGILSDIAKIQVVCTFNTNFDNIDSAVTRKGRLVIEHEFKSLSVENSNKLLKKLGKNFVTTREMSLAEIYNIEEDNRHKEKEERKVGFAA